MPHNTYRVIDANFNRAREAMRVMEDFCRFALNCDLLTQRAKLLRHQLSAAIAKIETGRLIAARDTLNDIGVGKTVDNQMQRADLSDCFTAASKRLTEALRTIEEAIRTFDVATAKTIENLRYNAYTLEKDIVIFSDTAGKFKKVRLYVVISSQVLTDILRLTNCCIAGGADCIQLRAKNIDDEGLFALAVEFAKVCRNSGVLCIINDRADIAIAAGADGVHLGQNDLPIGQVRKLQQTPLIVGKSTHSPEQLRTAISEMPAYVSLGPVFATTTKPVAEPVGLDYVTEAAKILEPVGISSVAIGGITLKNLEQVLSAGAKRIAVCSAVTETADPVSVCKEFKKKIETFTGS